MHPEQLAQILELLHQPGTNDRTAVPRYFLSGADPGEQVEIPARSTKCCIRSSKQCGKAWR